MKIIQVVSAIIRHDDQILMIKQPDVGYIGLFPVAL